MPTLYWKSTCTTCREVRAVLRAELPGLVEYDYAKQPLSYEQVRGFVAAAGGVAVLLNTTHATAKAQGWKQQPPDVHTFANAAVLEVNLLRRPILVRDDGTALVHKACLEAL